jgi:hypothetical protein
MGMSGVKLSDDVVAEIVRRTKAGESQSAIAKALGIAESSVSRHQKLQGVSSALPIGKNPSTKSADFPGSHRVVHSAPGVTVTEKEYEEKGDTATVTVMTPEVVKTEQDAIRVAEVDLSRWYVDSFKVKAYNGFHKTDIGSAVVTQLFSVTLNLKRLLPKAVDRATDAVIERLKKYAPNFTHSPPKKSSAVPMLVVPCLHDIHVGKLAWHKECGENYDVDIAVKRFGFAVDDMVADAVSRPGTRVGEVLFVVGSDLLHMNGPDNKTRAGTLQDVDGRYHRVLEATEMMMIEAVRKFAAVSPVTRVVFVPGNHDPHTAHAICRVLSGVFSKHSGVTVDTGPNPRKYYRHGVNLIGVTHGDRIKPADLPTIMAVERPSDWSETHTRLWFTGHLHHRHRTAVKTDQSRHGVQVVGLPSLSGPDYWHHESGYVGEPKCAEVHYFRHDLGHDGCKIVYARDKS